MPSSHHSSRKRKHESKHDKKKSKKQKVSEKKEKKESEVKLSKEAQVRLRKEKLAAWKNKKAGSLVPDTQITESPKQEITENEQNIKLEDNKPNNQTDIHKIFSANKIDSPIKKFIAKPKTAPSIFGDIEEEKAQEAPKKEVPDFLRKMGTLANEEQLTNDVNNDDNNNNVKKEEEEEEDDEIDPLDAFMQEIQVQVAEEEILGTSSAVGLGERVDDKNERPDFMTENNDDDDKFVPKSLKSKEINHVDHEKTIYAPFTKDFYIETPDLAKMTKEQVDKYRIELGNIKIRGKGEPPKPIKTFAQCGFPDSIFRVLKKNKFLKPTPIQSQAIPTIMKGRDVIGCAKTGSGKTLAFLLPMLRHILDQPPLKNGEGMIGLVMAPTRELALQIFADCKKFAKPLGLNVVVAYGGSRIAEQISQIKRGCEIVVCTPGRMIDLLTTNNGKLTNLERVTYLCLDEADRMFDMGFEPQIMKIIENVRPDRQTVLFSATFPPAVELAARKILKKPLIISVGDKNRVCDDVEQHVEIVRSEYKFKRLMELMQEWYTKGNVLIFVDTQETCDRLYRQLTAAEYLCASLHGGIDQLDRDCTLDDFKKKIRTVLIATSIAARGLDVADLLLVINYSVPNHLEDYVHRVGRTGRAGRKGTSYTFITPEEDKYAEDVVKALEDSNTAVPESLTKLLEAHERKKKAGVAEEHGSGYGGTGYGFNEAEAAEKAAEKKAARRAQGIEDDSESDHEDSEEELNEAPLETGISQVGGITFIDPNLPMVDVLGNPTSNAPPKKLDLSDNGNTESVAVQAAKQILHGGASVKNGALASAASILNDKSLDTLSEEEKKQAVFKAALSLQSELEKAAKSAQEEFNLKKKRLLLQQQGLEEAPSLSHFEAEMEINDYPQEARWKVVNRDSLSQICELLNCAITVRGSFIPPQRAATDLGRKLHLYIEGPDERTVKNAKSEIKRILDDAVSELGPGNSSKQDDAVSELGPGRLSLNRYVV